MTQHWITLALFTLRWREPGLFRPYRAWGYPVVPAVYLAANLMLAWMMLRERPQECEASLALLAFAVLFDVREPSWSVTSLGN